MGCTPVTGSFELFDRSQVRSTSAEILQREKQLNEKMVVKPQARRGAGEHQLCHPGQPLRYSLDHCLRLHFDSCRVLDEADVDQELKL